MTAATTNPPNDSKPSFFRRIPLAFGAFFRTLFNPDYAVHILRLRHDPTITRGDTTPSTPAEPAAEPAPVTPAPPPPLKEASPEAALQLLSLLQRDARLLDFTAENLASYADADIGAAARVVHEGCRKVLNEHFSIAPVRTENEGARITLDEGFDAASVRLTGNVVGKAPFNGSLTHRGWKVTEIRMPKLTTGHDATILAPAEVEL